MRKLRCSSIDQSPNTSNFEWSNSISDISKNEISFIIGSKLNSSKNESKLFNRNLSNKNKNNITLLNISESNYGIHKSKKSGYLSTISKPNKPTFKNKRKGIRIKKSNNTLLLERRLRSYDRIELTENEEIKTDLSEKTKSATETSISGDMNGIVTTTGDLFRNSLPILALQPCAYVSPLVGSNKVFQTGGKRKSIVMFSCNENATVDEMLHPTNEYSKKKSEKLQILPKKKVAKNFYRKVLTKEAFKGNKLDKKQRINSSLNCITNQSMNISTQKSSDESSILPNTSEDANSFDSNIVQSSTSSSNLSIELIKTPKISKAMISNQNIGITDCENKENMYINSENSEADCLADIASNENISANCSLIIDKLLNTNETSSNKSENVEKSISECIQSYSSFNSKEQNLEENVSIDECFTNVISNEASQNKNFKTKSFEENQYNIINDSTVSDNSYQLSHDIKTNENGISNNILTSTNQVENLDKVDYESQTESCMVKYKYIEDSSHSPIKKLEKSEFYILNLTGNSKKSYSVSTENKTKIHTSYSESKNGDKMNSSNKSELSLHKSSFPNDSDGKQLVLSCSRLDLENNIDNIENFKIVDGLSFLSNSSHSKDNGESKLSDDATNKSSVTFHQKSIKDMSINQNDSILAIINKSENESHFRYNLRTRNNVSNDNTIYQVSLGCSPVKAKTFINKECDEDQTEIIKTNHSVINTQELTKTPILKNIIYNKESSSQSIIDLDKSSCNQSDKSNNLVSADKTVINGTQKTGDSSQTINKTIDLTKLHENVYFNENCRQESLNSLHNMSSVNNSKNDISGLKYDSYKNINDEILQEYNKQDVHNAETTFNSSVVSKFSENRNNLSSNKKCIFQNENKNTENSILNESSQNNKPRYNLRERLNKTTVQKLDSKQTKSLPNFKLVNYDTSREDNQSTIQIQKTANMESCLNQIVNYDLSTSISNIDQSSVKQIKKVTFSSDTKMDNMNSCESNEESNNLSIKSVHPLESLKSSSKLIEKMSKFQNSSNESQSVTQNSNLKLSQNYINRVFYDVSHLLNIKEIDKTKSVNEFLEILVPNYSSYESSIENFSCQDHTSFTKLESPQLVTTSLQNIFNKNLLNIDQENNNCNTITKGQPIELECEIKDNKTNHKYSEIGTQTVRRGKLTRMQTMNKINRETQCKLSLCKTDVSICQTVNTEQSLVSAEVTKNSNEIPILCNSTEKEIQKNDPHEVIKFNITADMELDTRSYFESTRLMNLPKEHCKPNVSLSPIESQKSVIMKSNDENINEGIIENSLDSDEESDIDSETDCSVINYEDSESNNLNNKFSLYKKQCDIIEEENEEEHSTVIDAQSKTIHHTLCIESPVNTTKRKHNIKLKSPNQLENGKEADLSHFPSPIKGDFKKVRFSSSVDSVDGFSTFIEKNNVNKSLSFVSPNDPIITVEGISFRGDGKRTRARAVSNPYETIVYQRENICYRKIDPSPTKIRERKARLKQHLSKSKSKPGKFDLSKYIDSPDNSYLIIRNPITNIEERIKVIFDITEYYNIGFCKTNSLVIRKNVFTKQIVNNQSDSIIQMIPIKQKRSSITALIDKYKISFRSNQKMIVPKNIPYALYNPNNQIVTIIQTVSLPSSQL